MPSGRHFDPLSGYPIGNALGTRGPEFQFGSASPTNSFSDLHADIWLGLLGAIELG